MAGFKPVAHVDQIPFEEGIMVELDGQQIAVFHTEHGFYATANACPHAGGSLSEGFLSETVIACPWHSAHFDVTTGKLVSMFPATVDVTCYQTKVEDDHVWVKIP
ncbi:MAG: nitrite reductase small subunit NirD [Anaerolineae bacterium]